MSNSTSFAGVLAEKRRSLKESAEKREIAKKELQDARRTLVKSQGFILPASVKGAAVDVATTVGGDLVERVSGFSISKRQVSAILFEQMVKEMTFVPLIDLPAFLSQHEYDVPGDYLIVAIVSQKSNTRDSSKGSKYCFLELYDLMGTTIKLFLFKSAYEKFSGIERGSLLAILNPHALKPIEGKVRNVALSIDSNHCLMKLGMASDFAICPHLDSETGKSCSNPVDLRKGRLCQYHVLLKYRDRVSKRPEFGSVYTCPDSEIVKKDEKGNIIKRIKVGGDRENEQSNSIHRNGCAYVIENEVVSSFAKSKMQSDMLSADMVRQIHFSKDKDCM